MFYSSAKAKAGWPSATAHKLTKVPPELIQHLKMTADIPKKSKENYNPREALNVHPDIKIQQKPTLPLKTEEIDKGTKLAKCKIIEGDISKIASSYVLEGNLLKKKQVYEEVMKKQKKKVPFQGKENGQQPKALDRKEVLKLEYLEKMGFLRPEEETSLAQYRKIHPPQPLSDPAGKKHQNPISNQSLKTEYPETMNYMPFYSPKNVDPKMLPGLYSSSSKFMHPHMPYY